MPPSKDSVAHLFPLQINTQDRACTCHAKGGIVGLTPAVNVNECELRPTPTAMDDEHFINFNSYVSTYSPFSNNGDYVSKLVSVATGLTLNTEEITMLRQLV